MNHEWTNPARPPTDADDLGSGVWVSWAGAFNQGDQPMIWHWCNRNVAKQLDSNRMLFWYEPHWVVVGVQGHQLIARQPLHLEPSILWPDCCGMHGWIRDGLWVGV